MRAKDMHHVQKVEKEHYDHGNLNIAGPSAHFDDIVDQLLRIFETAVREKPYLVAETGNCQQDKNECATVREN